MNCYLCDCEEGTQIVGYTDSATLPARPVVACGAHAWALRDYLGLAAVEEPEPNPCAGAAC